MPTPLQAELTKELAKFMRNGELSASSLAAYLESKSAQEGLSNPLYKNFKDARDALVSYGTIYDIKGDVTQLYIGDSVAAGDIKTICKTLKDNNVIKGYSDNFVTSVLNVIKAQAAKAGVMTAP